MKNVLSLVRKEGGHMGSTARAIIPDIASTIAL